LIDDGITIAQLERVGMRYGAGSEVLHEIDLTLAAGSFRFLLGPAGAGKTSLLRLLRLGHPPSQGRLRLFGRDTARLGRDDRAWLRRRIGVVFQDLRLLDHLSAYDNVALRLRIAGLADDEAIAAEVAPLLAWLGLGEALEQRPPELTPAQRQLVAVARAVIGGPALLLADEPLANLDPTQARQVMRLFLSLHRRGATVLLATRDHGLPQRYPLAVIGLQGGQLTALWVPRLARSA
jgi:cell division transport system ATP-binding protein